MDVLLNANTNFIIEINIVNHLLNHRVVETLNKQERKST